MAGPTVEVKTHVRFKIWSVPGFAVIDLPAPGDPNGAAIPVKDLTDEALDVLAHRWLVDLYEKADKHCPFQLPASP